MDYYEEFGLRCSAAPEEIRQAYKAVTRLLHPDGQTDARLKAIAECQMKRANEVFGVLLDPQKRISYDASLEPHVEFQVPMDEWRPARPRRAKLELRHGFWVLILAMLLGSCLWYVAVGGPANGGAIDPASSAASVFDAPPSMVGTWKYYSRAAEPGAAGAPDAVLQLTERGGTLVGDYREATSPRSLAGASSIAFHLEGKPSGNRAASFSWTSPDGGKGEMDISVQSASTVRAIWWTTRIGSRYSGTTSGATLLTRQPTP